MATILKVIGFIADSTESYEAATDAAVAKAAELINNIQNVHIVRLNAVVEDNDVIRYHANTRISYLVEDNQP
jgi:dodecin